MLSLIEYARLNNVTCQTAFDECKALGALSTVGSKILVDDEIVNPHLENEIIDGLKNIKEGEIR